LIPVEGEQDRFAILTGPLRGRAELSDVLNTLREMHLTVLEVEPVPRCGRHFMVPDSDRTGPASG
jgi:hypothetical protein